MKKLVLGSLSLLLLATQASAQTQCQVSVNFQQEWVGKNVAIKRCIDPNCQNMEVLQQDYMVPVTTGPQLITVPCYANQQAIVVAPTGSDTVYYSPAVTVTQDKPTWATPVTFGTTVPTFTPVTNGDKDVETEESTTIENGKVKHEKSTDVDD